MKKSVYLNVLCAFVILTCTSCGYGNITVSESMDYLPHYEDSLTAVCESYSYNLEKIEVDESSRELGRIAEYYIQINDTAEIRIYIRVNKVREWFTLEYKDTLDNTDERLHNYDETLIHSIVDLSNCLSGKEFPYEYCYEFLKKSPKPTDPNRSVEDHYRSLDFWDTWRISYQFSEKTFSESVVFVGETKLMVNGSQSPTKGGATSYGLRPLLLSSENHSLGEWFKRSLVAMM